MGMGPKDTVDEGAVEKLGMLHEEGLLVEHRHLLALLETWTANRWNDPTLCEGRRVRRVLRI